MGHLSAPVSSRDCILGSGWLQVWLGWGSSNPRGVTGQAALLDRGHARGQARLIPRGGVLVHVPFWMAFRGRNGPAIDLLGSSFVALRDDLAHFAQLGAKLEVLARLRVVRCSVWRTRFSAENDLPCVVRYLRVFREIFGWVRNTYYRGATLERSISRPHIKFNS